MFRLIAVVAILSLAAPNLAEATCFGCDAKQTQDAVDECLRLFGQVKDMPSLDTFLSSICDQIDNNDLTKKAVSKCLGSSGEIEIIVFQFRTLLTRSLTGESCSKESTQLLLELQDKFAKMKENKLTGWFEKFLRQTIVACKRNFTQQFSKIERQIGYLAPVTRLASDFDWTHIDQFIREYERQVMSGELPTSGSGSIDELMRLDQLDKIHTKKSKATYVPINSNQYESLRKMLGTCVYLLEVKEIHFDPIVNIIKLGYNDEGLGLDAAMKKSLKSLDAWLMSIQLCAILNHADIVHMGGELRLGWDKSGWGYIVEPKKEDWQTVERFGAVNFALENLDQLEGLIVPDSKALEDIRRKYKKESQELVEAVTSTRFFEVLAAYLQSL